MSSSSLPQWDTIVSYLNNCKESLRYYSPFLHYKLTHIRNWTQFFNFHNFNIPKTIADFKTRVSNNLNYFSSNYIVIGFVVTLVILLFNWSLLIVLTVLIVGLVILQNFQEIQIMGRVHSSKNIRVVLLTVVIGLGIWFDLIHALLEVIGYSLVVIVLHASVIDGYNVETSFNESPV